MACRGEPWLLRAPRDRGLSTTGIASANQQLGAKRAYRRALIGPFRARVGRCQGSSALANASASAAGVVIGLEGHTNNGSEIAATTGSTHTAAP